MSCRCSGVLGGGCGEEAREIAAVRRSDGEVCDVVSLCEGCLRIHRGAWGTFFEWREAGAEDVARWVMGR